MYASIRRSCDSCWLREEKIRNMVRIGFQSLSLSLNQKVCFFANYFLMIKNARVGLVEFLSNFDAACN